MTIPLFSDDDLALSADDLAASLPDVSSPMSLPGLDGTVTIFRDTHGIPHVRAETAHDAFFGQGFATAQDRFWHMEHDRRMAYGRWAEVVGDSAVEQDTLMRRLGIGPSVEVDIGAINAETRAMLEAYAAGVNAFIETTRELPVEFRIADVSPEPWRPQDCLAVFKVRHILMGVFEGKLWRASLVNELGVDKAAEIIPDYPIGHLQITPPGTSYTGGDWDALAQLAAGASNVSWLADAEGGSNNWALLGSRTASGKPLVAGDPHRPLDTPNVYYQNHIACPDFDALGLSFPGCPGFPHFGHNANVAWCVTHAQADYHDLYVERFNDSGEYEWKGEWRKADVRRETIRSRGGGVTEFDVVSTHHGPVILGGPPGYGIASKQTSTAGPNAWAECLPLMLRAGSVNDMDEAMRGWVDPCNNFVFADVDGDVEYLNRGRLPVRPALNGWLPVPGWSGEYEWDGFVPFEELVRSRNPETGYIVTANNRIAPDDYPHYIALHYAPEYRARRIKDRVEKLDAATVDDMAGIHAEITSIPAKTYARLLRDVEPLDQISAESLAVLDGWDGSMDRDAVAPTIYSAFRRELEWALMEHHLGPLVGDALSATGRGAPMHVSQMRTRFESAAARGDASVLPEGASWSSVAAQALSRGVTWLRVTLGDDMDSWQWGSVHSTRPTHTLSSAFPRLASLLDPPRVPMSGDGDTPHAASYSQSEPFTAMGMSVARYIFDLADWDNSRWITPLGSSGHPGSPHYADQTAIWAKDETLPMLYDWTRIEAQAETMQELTASHMGSR